MEYIGVWKSIYTSEYILHTMAKPIRATPTLRGKEAVDFIREVIREQEHPSEARVKLIKAALKMKFNVR